MHGEEIYFNHNGKICLLKDLGRYCYFEASHFSTGGPGLMVGFIFLGPPPSYKKYEFIISIKTGNEYYLSPDLLEQILNKSDKNLLMLFENESKKRKKLRKYINLLNERCAAYTE